VGGELLREHRVRVRFRVMDRVTVSVSVSVYAVWCKKRGDPAFFYSSALFSLLGIGCVFLIQRSSLWFYTKGPHYLTIMKPPLNLPLKMAEWQ